MAGLDNILIFVKVAQFESITRAARSLGMPISTVSRRLSVLESELGVSLLGRTTRRGTLTAPGGGEFIPRPGAPELPPKKEEGAAPGAKKTGRAARGTPPVHFRSGTPFLFF